MDEIKYLTEIKADLKEALRTSGPVEPQFYEIVSNIEGRLTALKAHGRYFPSSSSKSKFMEEMKKMDIASGLISDEMEKRKWLFDQLVFLVDKYKEDKEGK